MREKREAISNTSKNLKPLNKSFWNKNKNEEQQKI